MDIAIDPLTNEEISALDVNVSKFRNYICPSCEAPVQLRRGNQRVYFAHVIGQANLNCEKYIPGTYAEKLLLKSIQQERLLRSLGLYIRVIEDIERYSWHLEIGIPEPDRTFGILKVPFGRYGERTIPINQIRSGGLRIGVIPKESEYRLTVDQLLEGDWYNRVIQPIEGLSNYTVFRYSPHGGRRLRENQSLFWGKAYLVIWKIGADPEWYPEEEELVIRYLKIQDSWTGIMINLPNKYNHSVEKWVKVWLKRNVEFPPVDLTLISPFPIARLPDNSMVIEPRSDVLISVVGAASSKKWNEICLYSTSENKIIRHRGNGVTPYLLSLGRLENGRINVWIDEEFENGIQIIVSSQSPKTSLESPSVKFFGYKRETNELISTSLHSSKIMGFIMDWYSKNIIVNKIYVPNRLSINIKWCVSGEKKAYERNFVDNIVDTYSDIGDQLCSFLNDLLLVELTQLVIETKEYGKVCVDFKHETEVEINMSDEWRKRVKWLLIHSMVTGLRSIQTTPCLNKQNFKYLSEKDKALVIKLLNSLIPVELSGQYHRILKELNQAIVDKCGRS